VCRGSDAVNEIIRELGKGHGCDSTYLNNFLSTCKQLRSGNGNVKSKQGCVFQGFLGVKIKSETNCVVNGDQTCERG
jgi:hypothetical protein